MKFFRQYIIVFSMVTSSFSAAYNSNGISATPDPKLQKDFWNAFWITHPTASGVEYGVYHFRKSFLLDTLPGEFIINISADNRYKLYVNGQEVCFGPARGDLANWYYETIDIATFLKPGENILAAVVWNYGLHRPWAQHSLRTAFMVQANNEAGAVVNTNSSWKVLKNNSYSPVSDFSYLNTFIVVGPGERINGNVYPWGWQQHDYDDGYWDTALQIVNPKPYGVGTDIDWVMTPRDIPLMENKKEPLRQMRTAQGIDTLAQGILKGESDTVPAGSKIILLLDNGHLTMGYPVLNLSGGANSTVTLTYAEALFDNEGRKGHRDSIEGMQIKGVYDVFRTDGGNHRIFSPLWYRTFRYIQLQIETGTDPLIINDIHTSFSAYPFSNNASFVSANPLFDRIWETGWRTARLCAQETYYDCPYYEQLQYIGDTRIQALISLYVSGDDLLMRKALHMFDVSRVAEGITQSRYPSYSPQFIPPYSLVWINMIHDYYTLRKDDEFMGQFETGIKNILSWYEQYIDPATGLLGKVPYWNFVDWTNEWPWDNTQRVGGVPAGGNEGNSSILTLQLAYTLREAAALMDFYGDFTTAEKYREQAKQLNKACMQYCWSSERGLFADTPAQDIFSQHANIMGILSGAVEDDLAMEVMDKILIDTTLIQTTIYFRFYLFLAMIQTGNGNMIPQQLGQWEDMLELGLTTFAEKPEPTRSDCHAWSASPLYFFLSAMAGIKPAEPGFKSVMIEPNPGEMNVFEASMPHPEGLIKVKGELLDTDYSVFNIELPPNTSGRLIWKNKGYSILPGSNTIQTR